MDRAVFTAQLCLKFLIVPKEMQGGVAAKCARRNESAKN